VSAFIDQYNKALNLIRDDSKYDATTKTAGVLFGDATARTVAQHIRTLVSSRLAGAATTDKYQSLMDIGLSFGKVGSPVGTTNDLTLDQAKLVAALQDDPDAVEAVFKAFSNTAVFTPGGGSIDSISGAPTDLHKSGQYVITSVDNGDATATLSAVFTPTGGSAQAAGSKIIAAGATSSSLIRGVAITVSNPVVNGTDTIDVTLDNLGIGHMINDYLSDLIGISGVFRQRDQQADTEIKRLNEDITTFNDHLAARRQTLERQFAALESTLSNLQQQQASLGSQMSQLKQ
jgi:flagellar hook-associated protein 2